MNVNEDATMFADNFRILASILPKPVASHAFSFLRIETLSTSVGENFLYIPEDCMINIIIYGMIINITAGLI